MQDLSDEITTLHDEKIVNANAFNHAIDTIILQL
jgi:hypothetical protein